jgi:uncharacterized membrane protein YhaH (DUF805 family)
MPFCNNCGAVNEDKLDVKICEECGHPLYLDFEMYDDESSLADLADVVVKEKTSVWHYFLKCFRNYANFKGKASRKEFWSFVLVNMVIMVVLLSFPLLPHIYAVFIFLPLWAVLVRRLHDRGENSWILWCYVPGIIYLVSILSNLGAIFTMPENSSVVYNILFVYGICLTIVSLYLIYVLVSRSK